MRTRRPKHEQRVVRSSQKTPSKDNSLTGPGISRRNSPTRRRFNGKVVKVATENAPYLLMPSQRNAGRATCSQKLAILVYGKAIRERSPTADYIVVDTGRPEEVERSKDTGVMELLDEAKSADGETIPSVEEAESVDVQPILAEPIKKTELLQKRELNREASAIDPIRNADKDLKPCSTSSVASQQENTAAFELADQVPSTGTDTARALQDLEPIPSGALADIDLPGTNPNVLIGSKTNYFANLSQFLQDLSTQQATGQTQRSAQAPVENALSMKPASRETGTDPSFWPKWRAARDLKALNDGKLHLPALSKIEKLLLPLQPQARGSGYITPQPCARQSVTFVTDLNFESALSPTDLADLFRQFSRHARVRLRRPKGSANNIWPVDTLMWQSSLDFYKWYMAELGTTVPIPVFYVCLMDINGQTKQEFVIPACNKPQFQHLKQTILDFWIESSCGGTLKNIGIDLGSCRNNVPGAWDPRGNAMCALPTSSIGPCSGTRTGNGKGAADCNTAIR